MRNIDVEEFCIEDFVRECGKKTIIKPTDKQLRYISNLQRYRRDVPEFTGETIQEASEFISRYKDNPNRYEKDWVYIYDRPIFSDDDYPYFDDSDIDSYQESMYRSCFF